eukprot:363766-Chlamydomonas_euryale.AAC.1
MCKYRRRWVGDVGFSAWFAVYGHVLDFGNARAWAVADIRLGWCSLAFWGVAEMPLGVVDSHLTVAQMRSSWRCGLHVLALRLTCAGAAAC